MRGLTLFAQDLRFALRSLWRAKDLALTVIVTRALGSVPTPPCPCPAHCLSLARLSYFWPPPSSRPHCRQPARLASTSFRPPLRLTSVCGKADGRTPSVLRVRVLTFIVHSASPRDPLVLAGAVLAMSLLGLVAPRPAFAAIG
jgi:hypothetical protein